MTCNILCKNCKVCEPLLYSRKTRKGSKQEFKYCKQNQKYINLSSWYINNEGYAFSTTKINGKRKLFHSLLNNTENLVMDHINGIRTDNRLCNLRLVHPSINSQNHHNKRTSNFPGVYWNEKRQKWICKVYVKNKQITWRSFNTEIEAYDHYVKTKNSIGGIIDRQSHEYYLYCEWLSEQSQTKINNCGVI